MARCPFAEFRPLSGKQQPGMTARRIINHTMVESLSQADAQFKAATYQGIFSHFGVGHDGTVFQWQDTDLRAQANLDANADAVSIEHADSGTGFPTWDHNGSDVPAFTDAQVDATIRLQAWVLETHPSVPHRMMTSSLHSEAGIGWHRLGVMSRPANQPGYQVAGGETWSGSVGKVCPGDRRIAQLINTIIPAVLAGGARLAPKEEDMARFDVIRNADTGEMVLAAVGEWWSLPNPDYVRLVVDLGVAQFVKGMPEKGIPTSQFDFLRLVYTLSEQNNIDTAAQLEDLFNKITVMP